jgi:putative flippase GtrA
MSSRSDGSQGIDGMAAIQLARYALVGLLAVAIHYAALIVLVELTSVGKVLASIVGFCLAIPVNYHFQHRWVFQSQNGHRVALPRYLTVTAIGLAINAVAFNGGLEVGLPYLLAQAIAIVLVVGFNFMANRVYTFGGRSTVRP